MWLRVRETSITPRSCDMEATRSRSRPRTYVDWTRARAYRIPVYRVRAGNLVLICTDLLPGDVCDQLSTATRLFCLPQKAKGM